MAIYFDLMALDQQERERKQKALQEAARIGLQAYLQTWEQNRADDITDVNIGQKINNKALIDQAASSRYKGSGSPWESDEQYKEIVAAAKAKGIDPLPLLQQMGVTPHSRDLQKEMRGLGGGILSSYGGTPSGNLPLRQQMDLVSQNVGARMTPSQMVNYREVARPEVMERPQDDISVPKMYKELPEQQREQMLSQQTRQATDYMDALNREQSLPYWKTASEGAKQKAMEVLARRMQPTQRTIREEVPKMNSTGWDKLDAETRRYGTHFSDATTDRPINLVGDKQFLNNMRSVIESPKQSAKQTGLPVKEVLNVRNSVTRSGIRGADGSEYVANFEDALSVMANPRATREEKILALGRFYAQDKMISEYYGDNQASQYMKNLLTGYMGGGGGGVGKTQMWRKGSEVIELPRGTTPGDLAEKNPKLRGLGNKAWDPVNPTDALSREKEKADIMQQIATAKTKGVDTADLETQLSSLNYGDATKPKIVTAPNWNNAFGLQPYSRQDLLQSTPKTQEYKAGVVYRVNGKPQLWDGEKFVEVPRNARVRKIGG